MISLTVGLMQDKLFMYFTKSNYRRCEMSYIECPICGASLDPGERCDCEKDAEKEKGSADAGGG